MKKTYIIPETKIKVSTIGFLLANSGVKGKLDTTVDDKFDIDYGGVDTDGSLDPSSNTWKSNDWDQF